MPKRLLFFIMAVAEAKEAKVWPEGKEKSSGGGISSSMAVFTVKGRSLATRGFMIILPVTSIISRAMAEARPVFLVFGIISSTRVSRIQKIPAFPRAEIKGIITSRNSFRSRCCTAFKKSISQLIGYPFVTVRRPYSYFSFSNFFLTTMKQIKWAMAVTSQVTG